MAEGPGTGRLDYPFVGIPSFLRSPLAQDLALLDADVAVLGAPTDEGSPFMPGSRFAPRSIREHSLRFVTDPPGFFDPQERRRFLEREMRENRIADVGDADVLPTNPCWHVRPHKRCHSGDPGAAGAAPGHRRGST